MTLTLPTIGFLVSSGIHKDFKQYFNLSHRRRGVYKALNTIIIRLGLLLSLPEDEASTPILNTLFTNMCYDDDIIFIVKTEPDTPMHNLIALIKQSLQTDNPIAFMRSRVSFSADRGYLIFDI